MVKKARLLVSWISSDSSKRCILSVKDHSLEPEDSMYRRLELCVYDSDDDEWNTEEVFDYVEGFEDYGIPEDFIS